MIKEKVTTILIDIKESKNQVILDYSKIESELWSQLQKIPTKLTEQKRIDRQIKLYEKVYMTLQEKNLEYEIKKAGIVQDYKILSIQPGFKSIVLNQYLNQAREIKR